MRRTSGKLPPEARPALLARRMRCVSPEINKDADGALAGRYRRPRGPRERMAARTMSAPAQHRSSTLASPMRQVLHPGPHIVHTIRAEVPGGCMARRFIRVLASGLILNVTFPLDVPAQTAPAAVGQPASCPAFQRGTARRARGLDGALPR